jgi:hypothetical protein
VAARFLLPKDGQLDQTCGAAKCDLLSIPTKHANRHRAMTDTPLETCGVVVSS